MSISPELLNKKFNSNRSNMQSRKPLQQSIPQASKDEGSSVLKQIVVAGAAVGAVVGGVYLVYKLSSGKRGGTDASQDDDAFSAKPVEVAEQPAKQQTQQASEAAAPRSPNSGMQRQSTTGDSTFTRDYSFRVTAENEEMIEAALKEHQKEVAAQAHTVQGTIEKPVHFPHLALTFTAFPGWRGWNLNEEMSPMPNMAIVTITKPEFQERNQQRGPGDMGSDPIILMTIEDISNENLNHLEFKEKSKQMAIAQMMQMTGGMYQPKFYLDDDNIDIGTFKACLEYGQSLPPYLDIRVCNLIAVQNGLAYIFQLMAKPDVLNQYRKQFMGMARHVQIETFPSVDFTRSAHKVVVSGGCRVAIPASWSVVAPQIKGAAIMEIHNASSVKTEVGHVYPVDEVPEISGAKSTSKSEGVEVTSVQNGRTKIYTSGKFALVVNPQQKATVATDDRLFAFVVKSLAATSESQSESFFHAKDKYKFATCEGSKVVASLIGKGAVIYAPEGVPTQEEMEAQAEQGPTVTIRVGDPSTESDCLSTLDEWEQNFRNESAEGNISGVTRTKLNGHDCVMVINKDMQEVGPGQRIEIMAKIFVFVKDGKTTLVRWEVTTGQFKKYERKMNQFMDSFTML